MPQGSPITPEELVVLHARMRPLALRLFRDPHAAEDALQEVLLGAHRARHVRNWMAWSRGALHKVFLRCSERARRERDLWRKLEADRGSRSGGSQEGLDPQFLRRRLTELIHALSSPYRDVLLELELCHRSVPEVARARGISESTVRTQRARGLQLLRKRIESSHDRDAILTRLSALVGGWPGRLWCNSFAWRPLLVANLGLAACLVAAVLLLRFPGRSSISSSAAGLDPGAAWWGRAATVLSADRSTEGHRRELVARLPIPAEPDFESASLVRSVPPRPAGRAGRFGFGSTPLRIQPGDCALVEAAPIGETGWLVGNLRRDVCFSDPGIVEIRDGMASLQMVGHENDRLGAEGDTTGYLALFREVAPTDHFRVVCDIFVAYVEDPELRPVGSLNVSRDLVFGPEAATTPLADAVGAGWQTVAGQVLGMLLPAGFLPSGYVLAPGSWHTVEIVSFPQGATLRAWPSSTERPQEALLRTPTIGTARHVLFSGGNYKSFDWAVREVVFTDLTPVRALETGR